MGKRQIGQLEISDLVSTLLLSEIASVPIENRDIPIVYAVIPIILLMAVEIFSAALQGKYPKLKNLFSPRPSVIIRMGQPDFAELEKCRISADELLVALRHSGTTDISEVAYAILEQDGTVSVLPRAYAKPATASDVKASNTESGMFRIIIDHGLVNENSLCELSRDRAWLESVLSANQCTSDEVTLMLADEVGKIQIFKQKEGSPNE